MASISSSAMRVVIVTGAARGIGLACARRFYAAGYGVVLSDCDEPAGRKAFEDMGAKPERALFIPCDISRSLDVHNLFADVLNYFGRADVLVNNAGVAIKGSVLDLSEADFDRALGVNLRGTFLMSQMMARHMVEMIEEREDRSRLRETPYRIINMSSINDSLSLPDYLAYCVSKGGLKQMTKSMALALAPYGIRVNAIAPGSVKTDMLTQVAGDDSMMDKILLRTPLGRMGQADEIASVALFLASDDASYMTGEVLYVDGGRRALNYVMPSRTPE